MTSLRDALGISCYVPYGWVVRYSAGGHVLGEFDTFGHRAGTFLDFEMDAPTRHRSEYEAWMVGMLTAQFREALPCIISAGDAPRQPPAVKWLPYHLHYAPPDAEPFDCE